LEFFEWHTGHRIEDFASPLKTPTLVEGRIGLTLLGVSRYGFRSTDLAALLGKHPSSMTRWLNKGVSLEREDRDSSGESIASIGTSLQPPATTSDCEG
jgi:hypothetical protein